MDDTVLHTYQLFHGCEHIINSRVFKPVVRHVHNTAVRKRKNYHTHSFIQDFEFGGGEQGDSSVRKCASPSLMHVCLLGGSGGMPSPRKKFEFRSSQIVSDTIWDKIVA